MSRLQGWSPDGAVIRVPRWQAGSDTVEIWDTEMGEISSRETFETSGTLNVNLPGFAPDLAVKVKPG
ncbi:MAG TPA: hypothetical protein VHO69_18655 [Phototrophicaceae bacterium]|nr:hypothetical protein [Phototrophicaceae bacterium]